MSSTATAKKTRLTKEQKAAVDKYNLTLRQEDRYLGSVFVTPMGQRRHEADRAAAYERANRLLGPELSLRYL